MHRFLPALCVSGALFCFAADASRPLLVHDPTVNRTTVVFSYAGDLWSVPRSGGEAIRLTTGAGYEDHPHFSPDGTKIAFDAEYDGNRDVYVIDAGGSIPKRLTYHPAADWVAGWTPDGKRILFRSNRVSHSPRYSRLFTVSVDGGRPELLDLPMAEQGSYSPDGKRLAYLPTAPAFASWKRYRGGRTTRIWLAGLSDLAIEKVPRENSNDFNPMWVGNKVYFLSDRDNGPFTLYSYDPGAKKVERLIANDGLDIKSADAGPDAIAYEQFGSIHLYDLKSGRSRPVDIRIQGDIQTVRPSFEKVRNIENAAISPTGARAVVEGRGEILTVPVEKGDARNLTNTPGVAERDPAWSPDGKRIAYFSDESGEYALHVRSQNAMGDVEKISLGDPPGSLLQAALVA